MGSLAREVEISEGVYSFNLVVIAMIDWYGVVSGWSAGGKCTIQRMINTW